MAGYARFKALEDENVILTFKGSITPDLLSSILHIMENKLDNNTMVKRKVFNIMVEALQNLYFHVDDVSRNLADQYENDLSTGIFELKESNNIYHISTGNYVMGDKREEIARSIDMVNAMNDQELREYYKRILKEDLAALENDVGIGFVDIARKSDHKLEFSFQEVDDKIAFFSLEMKVNQV